MDLKVVSLTARPILDSRGEWTIEAELALGNGIRARASIPQGKSRGSREACVIAPHRAVHIMRHTIAPKARGWGPGNQKGFDRMLQTLDDTPDKRRVGGNTLLAASLAYARASAFAVRIPFWKYIRRMMGQGAPRHIPRLYANLINGGLHAGNALRFQEYLVIPKTANIKKAVVLCTAMYKALGRRLEKRYGKGAVAVGDEGGYAPPMRRDEEPLETLARVAEALGIHAQVDFGIDAAASNVKAGVADFSRTYLSLIRRFRLAYLEDPFGEDDADDFALLKKSAGARCVIVGDDLTVTNAAFISEMAARGAIGGAIIKPNQIGTLTEALDAVRAARRANLLIVASHRSGETNDDWIADFAFGAGADGLKLGAPAKGERIAKYNRVLEIWRETRR